MPLHICLYANPIELCALSKEAAPGSASHAISVKATAAMATNGFWAPDAPLAPLTAWDADRLRWWHGEPESYAVDGAASPSSRGRAATGGAGPSTTRPWIRGTAPRTSAACRRATPTR